MRSSAVSSKFNINAGIEDGYISDGWAYELWCEQGRTIRVQNVFGLDGEHGWKIIVFPVQGKTTNKLLLKQAIKYGAKIWPVHEVSVCLSESGNIAIVRWGPEKPTPGEIRRRNGTTTESCDNRNPPASMRASFTIRRGP